jgi:hypothetical protein
VPSRLARLLSAQPRVALTRTSRRLARPLSSLAAPRGPDDFPANLHDRVYEPYARLRSANESERIAIVHELVLKIEVQAQRDANGEPTFHYERRYRSDGRFWYAHRVPHVTVTVVYQFPEGEIPVDNHAEERTHGHEFIAAISRKYAFELR